MAPRPNLRPTKAGPASAALRLTASGTAPKPPAGPQKWATADTPSRSTKLGRRVPGTGRGALAARLAVVLFALAPPVVAQPASGGDPFHPWSFVRVAECPSLRGGCADDDLEVVVGPGSDGPREYVNAEVDVDSKVLITFDRRALARLDSALVAAGAGEFEAAVTVSARIGDRPVEVPGYSVVGEQARTAVARVRSAGELRTAFASARRARSDVAAGSALDGLRRDAFVLPGPPEGAPPDPPEAAALRSAAAAAAARASEARRTRDELLATYGFVGLDDVEAAYDRVGRLAQTGPTVDSTGASAQPELDAALVQTGFESVSAVRAFRARIARLAATAGAAQDSADTAADSLDALLTLTAENDRQREDERRQQLASAERARASVDAVRRGLLVRRAGLGPVLRTVAADANRPLVAAYADVAAPPQNAGRLVVLAAAAAAGLDALAASPGPATPDEYARTAETARGVLSALDALAVASDAFGDDGSRRLRGRLLYDLVDTAVLLRQADARPGDVLTLTVENRARAGDVPRTLTVRLTVRDFGLVRDVADSFLFLRRPGADPADIVGEGVEVSDPRDVDFEPAPGATLGWTYRPRPHQAPFLGFLTPGFGLNVSFPRFGKLELRPGGDGDPGTLVEDSTLDVAVGAVLSLFDGAIVATAGLPLTSRGADAGDNWYWGLGFSFVNIADRVGP